MVQAFAGSVCGHTLDEGGKQGQETSLLCMGLYSKMRAAGVVFTHHSLILYSVKILIVIFCAAVVSRRAVSL